jgi:hypothetical protein
MPDREQPQRRRLSVVRKAIQVPKLWLPGRVREKVEEEREHARKNRAERRRRRYRVRPDGSRLTRPSLHARCVVRQRRNRAARIARRRTR